MKTQTNVEEINNEIAELVRAEGVLKASALMTVECGRGMTATVVYPIAKRGYEPSRVAGGVVGGTVVATTVVATVASAMVILPVAVTTAVVDMSVQGAWAGTKAVGRKVTGLFRRGEKPVKGRVVEAEEVQQQEEEQAGVKLLDWDELLTMSVPALVAHQEEMRGYWRAAEHHVRNADLEEDRQRYAKAADQYGLYVETIQAAIDEKNRYAAGLEVFKQDIAEAREHATDLCEHIPAMKTAVERVREKSPKGGKKRPAAEPATATA